MIFKQLVVGDLNSNCYIVRGPGCRETAIIDPGADADRIMFEVEKRSLEVCYLILTHGHHDHVGAAAALRERTGGRVVIHGDDEFLLAKHAGIEADGYLADGLVMEVGGLALEVVHTPGHTPGSVCIVTDGAVFLGDTLFAEGVGRTDFPYSSPEDSYDSIYRVILRMPDQLLALAGHGFISSIGQIKVDNPHICLEE